MEILLDIIRSVDYNILLLIADRLRGGVLDPVMTMLSLIGNGGAVWITLAVLLLFFRKTRRAGAAMLLAMLAGFLVGNLWLKELVMRPRPFVTHSDLTALLDPGDPWSFPSGHATAAFAAFGALLFSKGPKPLVIVVGLGALLMALTRLYCYVHYPTDVLAGTVVGLLAGFAAAKIVEAASRKLQERRSQSHT